MQKVTCKIWKQAKHMLNTGKGIDSTMLRMDLSRDTVYKIKRSKTYKGANGYFKTTPKNKYDNVMTDYIKTPQIKWWNKWKRGKK